MRFGRTTNGLSGSNESPRRSPVVVQNQGLQPVYAASPDPAKLAWQYDPQRNVMLELRNADRAELLSTQQISACQLTTQLRHDHLWHDVAARISAPPHSLVSIALPPGCRWQSFHIDGESINLSWPRTSEQCEIRVGAQGNNMNLSLATRNLSQACYLVVNYFLPGHCLPRRLTPGMDADRARAISTRPCTARDIHRVGSQFICTTLMVAE